MLSIKIGQNLRICMPFLISTQWCSYLCRHYGDSETINFTGLLIDTMYIHIIWMYVCVTWLSPADSCYKICSKYWHKWDTLSCLALQIKVTTPSSLSGLTAKYLYDPIRCFFPIQVASHLFIPKHKPFSVAHCQVAISFQTQSKANFPSRLTNN